MFEAAAGQILSTSSPSAGQPAPGTTEFHQFPKLPLELQLEVWKLAIAEPRVVAIKTTTANSWEKVDGRMERNTNYYLKLTNTIPATLHTCQISRQEALKTYKPSFQAQIGKPIYFNGVKDILFFNSYKDVSMFTSTNYTPHLAEDLKSVRHIAIGGDTSLPITVMHSHAKYFMELEHLYLSRRGHYSDLSECKIKDTVARYTRTWTKPNQILAHEGKEVAKIPEIIFLMPDKMEELLASSGIHEVSPQLCI